MRKTATFESRYKGKSICNILPTLAQFNKIKASDGIRRFELEGKVREKFLDILAKADRVVILQVDALGYDLFTRIRKNFKFLKNAEKISSVFPTYTHTAFASFVTGTTPSHHGVVAGTFLKDGKVDWMGNFGKSKSFSKNLILSNSLLWEFEKNGKKVISVLYDVNGDYYSKFLYPNIRSVPSTSSKDNLIKQAYEVEKRVFKKASDFSSQDFYILTIYCWYLDGVSGKYGKFSKESISYINFFFKEVETLMKSFPKQTLFLFTGDHGHTSLKKTVVISHEEIEEINKRSEAQFALDGRVMMFYTKKPGLTRKLFQEVVGSNVAEMSKEKYLEMLGGNCSPEIKKRVGNLIYLAKPYCTVRFQPKPKKATHGGPRKSETETVFGFFMN